ncbi:MAG: hypothetical protein OXD49_19355 [Candidatus Poribacteria bacterium]|nr:hypothetical protein [Candidatus Poribacteria bacterium]
MREKSLRAYQGEILAIPACLYPKWIEKLKRGQQYSVQTFTSAPKL